MERRPRAVVRVDAGGGTRPANGAPDSAGVFRYPRHPRSPTGCTMLNKDSLEQLRTLKQQLVTEKQQSQAQQKRAEAQRQKELDARKVRASGVVKGSPGRFGFVTLEDGRDIYLPQEQMQRVFPDDQVAIEIITGDDGKPSAAIERLVHSPLREFTGHYIVRDNAHFVEPDLPRLSRWIFVPPKARGEAKAGDLVSARISRHPVSDGKPQARIERIIGAADSAFIAQRYALARHQLPQSAPELVEADLEQPDDRERADLSALPFVTIDGNDTLDMDDALYAEPCGDGWAVWVAIADPGAWIKPGSALEQTIAARATSVYLPGYTVAMLPEALANERCSLQAGQERPALVCKLELNAAGDIETYAFSEARIRSRARLTYSDAATLLRDDAADSEWAASVRALNAAGSALQAQRRRAHLLMPEQPDYNLTLDADGRISAITRQDKTEAHRLVEECMVAVNRCAADFLKNDRAVFIGHSGFRGERRDNIARLVSEHLPALQGADVGSLEGYIAVMQAAAGAEALPLRAILARSLERSQFVAEAAPHFGMGLPCYTTVTSPLRKYNDYLAHRIIKAKLRGETPPPVEAEQLAVLQERNDQARQASQLAQRWLECRYLQTGDTPLRAVVRHINSSGLAVRLLDTGIEGFVDLRHTGEKYSFDQVALRLGSATRKFQLEQELDVAVVGVDLKKRTVALRLHDAVAAAG